MSTRWPTCHLPRGTSEWVGRGGGSRPADCLATSSVGRATETVAGWRAKTLHLSARPILSPAHNAGLSPSSTQGSEKAALSTDGGGEKIGDPLEADDLEKDLVIVDPDEIKLAEKEDKPTSADANGSSKTGVGIIATAAAVGAAGAAGAIAADALSSGGDSKGADAGDASSRPTSAAVVEEASRPASAVSAAASVTAQVEDSVSSRPASGTEPPPTSLQEEEETTASRPTSASASAAEGEVKGAESRAESVAKKEEQVETSAPVSRAGSAAAKEEEQVEVSEPVSRAESAAKDEQVEVSEPVSRAESAAKEEQAETSAPVSRAESGTKEEQVEVSEPVSRSESAAKEKQAETSMPVSRAASTAEEEQIKDSEPVSRAESRANDEQDETSEPVSRSESVAKEDEQAEVPELCSRPESATKVEADTSAPVSRAESAAEVETSVPVSRSVSVAEEVPAEPVSRPESVSKEEEVATEAVLRPESAAVETQGTRPTSASESAKEGDNRPASVAVSEKEALETELPKPDETTVETEAVQQVVATSPETSRPASSTPAPAETDESSRPQSAAVNPETGTPLILFSRPLSSEETPQDDSRPTTGGDDGTTEPTAVAEEVTHEGRVQEPEIQDTDSSQPSELVTEQASSVSIDAEELGVVEPNKPNTITEIEQAPIVDDDDKPQEAEEITETVSTTEQENAKESSRPASVLSAEKETESRPASASLETSRPTSASTVPVEDSMPQESSPKPDESRPISAAESTVAAVDSRPASTISQAESGVESTGGSDVISPPAETPRPESPTAEDNLLPKPETVEDDSLLNNAATTIQATFRGHQARKELKKPDEEESAITDVPTDEIVPEVDPELNSAATTIQANFRGFKTRQALKNQNEGDTEETAETEDFQSQQSNTALDSAATTIQANFRGFQTRQALKKQTEGGNDEAAEDDLPPPPEDDSEEQLNTAATTIQANFRGFQTRQALKKQTEKGNEETGEDDLPPPPEEDAEEQLNTAATTIQANFRGFQTRQTLKKQTEGANDETGEDDLPPPPEEDSEEQLNSAATTIQANFRGYQTRQALKGKDEEERKETIPTDLPKADNTQEIISDDPAMNSAATTIQANFRGYKTRQELKEKVVEEGSESLETVPTDTSLADSAQDITSAELNSAATTIQANFRGYQARQAVKIEREGEIVETIQVPVRNFQPVQNMPEETKESEVALDSAATTIQATFRGHQARKNLKESNETTTDIDTAESVAGDSPPVEITPQPEGDEDAAATKIQANFRGFQTRKALKEGAEETNEGVNTPANDADDTVVIESAEDSDLNTAATKIQANFRGFQTRKALKEGAEETNEGVDTPENDADDTVVIESAEDSDLNTAATKIQANFRGFQTRKALKEGAEEPNEEEAATTDADDTVVTESAEDSDLNTAATKIQANFRGFQTRRALKEEAEGTNQGLETPANDSNDIVATEIAEDSDLNTAATKIQANFRGFQTRKALKEGAEGSNEEEATTDADDTVAPESAGDSDLNTAATKIQANFRGFQTRKALKEGAEESNEEEAVTTDADDTIVTESAEDSDLTSAATKIQANFRGYQTRQNLKQQNEGGIVYAVPAIAVDSPVSENGQEPASVEAMNEAATKIQANFRGYQTRQTLKRTNDDDISDSVAGGSPVTEIAEEGDLNNAATTIQANFRGFQTRQALKKQSEGEGVEQVETIKSDNTQPIVPDEAMNSAATTIQANFRGFQTRQALKKSNEDGDGQLPDADPALHAAATTIQANFRGFQTRQNLQRDSDQEGAPAETHDALFGSPISGSATAAEESETSLTEVTGDASVITDTTSEREVISPPVEAATTTSETPRSPETGEKFKQSSNKTSVDEDEVAAKELQKPQECDELPSQRGLSDNSSLDLDSSYSSAATKIQAGVRGFIARRQVQQMRTSTNSTTAPSLPDSQQSIGQSISLDDDGVQAAGSPETEIQKQANNTVDDADEVRDNHLTAALIADASNYIDPQSRAEEVSVQEEKGLSLDSKLDAVTQKPKQDMRMTVSEHIPSAKGTDNEDQQVWQTLQKELEQAATTIQSNYRGYRTRQRLQREDAVQMPTTSSSTMSSVSEPTAPPAVNISHSGEFHDMIVLPPSTPTIPDSSDKSSDKSS